MIVAENLTGYIGQGARIQVSGHGPLRVTQWETGLPSLGRDLCVGHLCLGLLPEWIIKKLSTWLTARLIL